jgi:uncharacterized protein with GYD domain
MRAEVELMPTYVVLSHWTKEGLAEIQQSPSRLDAGRKAIEASGGKLKDFYVLMGQYDMMLVVEATDDATLARVNLSLASKGYVRTETHRAFTEDEYRKIISGVS